jgi:hypothetical protein
MDKICTIDSLWQIAPGGDGEEDSTVCGKGLSASSGFGSSRCPLDGGNLAVGG